MTQIVVHEPNQARPSQLTIDVVAKLSSGSYHVAKLTYDSGGLFDVPLTWKSSVDIHTSYHSDGEMHCKLARGKLRQYPGEQVIGKAKPHTTDNEFPLWRKEGQPWYSLKGVERVSLYYEGYQGFVDVVAMAAGYPIYFATDADDAFEIDAQSLASNMIDIAYFLVEAGNRQALEARMTEIMDSWRDPRESVVVEKAEVFANLRPWLAIVVFSKRGSRFDPPEVGSRVV